MPRATPVGQEGDPGVNGGKTKKGGRAKVKKPVANETTDVNPFSNLIKAVTAALASKEGVLVKRTVAVLTVVLAYVMGVTFTSYSWKLSGDLSHPSIIFRARTRAGNIIKIDDYREAYWWLRDNTPLDSRIVAWWDYGYQITGMS